MVTVKIDKKSACVVHVSMEISQDEIKAKTDSKYAEVSNTVALPGFRKGMSPRHLLEKKYGKTVAEEVKQELVQEGYDKAVADNSLSPVFTPDVDFSKLLIPESGPLKFEFDVEIKPVIEFTDYLNIPVHMHKIAITDKEVEEGFNALRENYAELIPVDRAAKEGDLLFVDQKVIVDGKDEFSDPNSTLWLDKKLAVFNQKEGKLFEGLQGKKAGEEFRLPVVLPAEFPKKALAGKDAEVLIVIKEVKEKKLPEPTDQWAKDVGAENMEKLRAEIKKRLELKVEDSNHKHAAQQIAKNLVDKATFDIPPKMLEIETYNYLARIEMEAKEQGVPDSIIVEELKKVKAVSAVKVSQSIRLDLVLEHIAKKEAIFATEGDVDQRIELLARSYGKWPNEIKAQMEKQGTIKNLRAQIREEKTMAFLLSKAAVSEIVGPDCPGGGYDKDEEDSECGPECDHDHEHHHEHEAAADKPKPAKKASPKKADKKDK